MSVNEVKIGSTAFIDYINCDEKLTKRLYALGAIKGTPVTIKASAPLGDPLILTLRGFDIAIRKKDAKNIHVIE